jgi:topoisomerase-4 subunit A
MESLFKLSDLEIRFGLNMNVLSAGQIPNVLGLRDVLWQWLEHRIEVLVRRSQNRLQKIEHRLEVLDGYLIAFLNIDEVIRIIRFEDEPKQELIARFSLTDVQAEAILNLRLRALSRLEEMQIRAEHERLSAEKLDLEALLASEDRQWQAVSGEVRDVRKTYAKDTELGRRRTDFADAPEIEIDLDQAMIEREPITVILSEKGWIRALKGHQDDLSRLDFKQGDRLKFAFHAQTTDRLLAFSTNGKFFTLTGDQLPGGRGHGEPLRLMIDLEENHDVAAFFTHKPGRKLLVASVAGYGFVVNEDDVTASTRKGKQVLNVAGADEAKCCVPADGNMVATVGENRKMLVFGRDEVNEMTRGKGVILQRLKGSALSDVRVFEASEGLTWLDSAGRTFTMSLHDLEDWHGVRAQSGKVAPRGFPRSNRFGPAFD